MVNMVDICVIHDFLSLDVICVCNVNILNEN